MELDGKDRAILRLLQLNARLTHAEIGEKIGLSPSACHRRVKLMEANGVIRGYTIVTGGTGDSDGKVNVLVQVTLERQTEDYLSRFERAVRECPEIRECFLMAGSVDYWLRVEAVNATAYERIHGEILSRLPGVTRINSSFAMRDALRHRRDGG
ncbi:Lrp/AsnC family transcriptional regulator [Sphingobium cloacae]|uniref:Transcriptional regulator n=1 Tax=Sphingobium cloacae TaxID=120107 RepID=A0A1E1F350_9SPHN|nr:Lrp/AsnC family transcriptional regulator [Sphingobium cloacae]BAV64958.1 transcriptional regulator [Sphingobium cloacae]